MVFSFRDPTLDDVDWITEACQDSEILRWTVVPRPYTKDHARSFVADHAGELHAWAIVAETALTPSHFRSSWHANITAAVAAPRRRAHGAIQ